MPALPPENENKPYPLVYERFKDPPLSHSLSPRDSPFLPAGMFVCKSVPNRTRKSRTVPLHVQNHSFTCAHHLELALHLGGLRPRGPLDPGKFFIVMSGLVMEQNQLFHGTFLGQA